MDGQQPFQRINDAYVLDWVSTLSPTTILNVRASTTGSSRRASDAATRTSI
jgi:hypothetical protein